MIGKLFVFCVPFALAAAYVYMVCRILRATGRPFVALGLCFLGGVVGALGAFLATQGYVVAHPIQQHGHEDWGAFAGALLYAGLLFVSPVIGFFIGFSTALVACWWLSEVAD
jgi:hypothetical protein